MKLALRELRRRPGRFVTATAILTLVAVLVMFLGGLLDGLIRNSTDAVRAQDGDLIVFSSTSQTSFLRSRIDPEARAGIEAVPGVADTGGLGLVQLGARVPGNGPRELASAALFGYELPPTGVPEPPAAGEVYADDVLRADGVEEGMEILLGPARSPVTVVGFVSGTTYSGQGSLWAAEATWREVLTANRPDQQLGDGVFQALVVRTADGGAAIGDVAAAIDDATAGATETLSVGEAVDAIPGVRQQRSTFNQIIAVTIAIAVVVVALFFALLTVERLGLYGVLKAVGARSATLFAGLVVQAVVVTAVAVTVATGLAVLLDAVIPPGSIPLDVTLRRIVTSAVLLLVAAVVGCAFSLRRVLRVDPASAIGTLS
jgi:putative ABC transport system permease protein